MKVVKLSLRIFSELTSRFRDHLKSEVEIFLSRIFLQLLQVNIYFSHQYSYHLTLLCD